MTAKLHSFQNSMHHITFSIGAQVRRRMPSTTIWVCGLVLAASYASAQTASPTPAAMAAAPQVLVRGPSGTSVTLSDLQSELQRAPEATRQAVLSRPESVQQLMSNLLVRRVLAAEAERDGLGADPVIAAALTIARDRVLSDARLVRIDVQNAPSEAAMEAYARNYYQVNTDKFQRPAQTRARHILLANTGADALTKAKDLLAQLRAGASFEELAKTNSIDPGSAVNGGDLGLFAAGRMVRPFDDAVNALAKPGDLSEPVESQFGLHIIKLEERREKGRQSFDEVRAQLMGEARVALLNELRVQKVQSMNQEFVFDLPAIEALAKPVAR